jgi:hypothetical protein
MFSTSEARAGLPDGEELIVIGETDNWYRVRDPETEKTGYVFKQYTAKLNKPFAISEETSDGTEKLGSLSVNGKFDLTCKLPANYTMQVINMKGSRIRAAILSDDMTQPDLNLTVAYDETYGEVERMNDLSEDDLKALEATFTDNEQVDISYAETGHGTRILIARENDGDGDTDYVDILAIYKGYFIEFEMTPNKDAAEKSLTEEQIRMCIDFLTNLDFNEAAA